MKSSNPALARVVAEINIHEAVAAIEHFAENGPQDRHSKFIGARLMDAALTICVKAESALQNLRDEAAKEQENKKKSNFHSASSYRFQSAEPNESNTPQAVADATGYVGADDQPLVDNRIVCPDCLVLRNATGPDRHSSNCPQIMESLKGKRDKAS